MTKKHFVVFILILACGLAVRMALFSRIAPGDLYAAPWYVGEGGDASEYSAIAKHIVEGQGYTLNGKETTIRPPGYVYALAAIYAVFGVDNLGAVRICQIALALATLALFWFLARRVTQSAAVAHLSTLALALHPRYAIYNLVILTETLFLALLVAMLWFALRFWERQARRDIVFAFVALALAALTRPAALYFAPALAWWAWYTRHRAQITNNELRITNFQNGFNGIALGIGAFLLVLAPWVLYNHARLGTFTFSSKSGGTVAESWDRTILEPLGISNRDILAPYKHLSEEAFAKAGYKLFFTEIRDHPLLIAKILILKSAYWFNPFAKISSGALRALHALFTTAIGIFGICGLWQFWRVRGKEIPLLFLLLMGVFSAMHILTVPYHRYRFPVMEPYLILFASYAIIALWHRIKRVWIPKASSENG